MANATSSFRSRISNFCLAAAVASSASVIDLLLDDSENAIFLDDDVLLAVKWYQLYTGSNSLCDIG